MSQSNEEISRDIHCPFLLLTHYTESILESTVQIQETSMTVSALKCAPLASQTLCRGPLPRAS